MLPRAVEVHLLKLHSIYMKARCILHQSDAVPTEATRLSEAAKQNRQNMNAIFRESHSAWIARRNNLRAQVATIEHGNRFN